MADDINKKVLIDIDLANQDAQTKMSALESVISDLAASTANLKTVTDNAKASFNAYSEKIQQSKLNIQQMREETARLSEEKKREKIATDTAKQSVVAASGSYKEAQQALTKLGNEIKNTAGSFKSQDAALKQQIADYNKLNAQLKAFDAQMGNHQRNVGNYSGALSSVNSAISQLIPGFSQFSSILRGATQGFNAMGKASVEAGAEGAAAEDALADSASAAGGAIAAVAAVIVAEGAYLLQFQKYADGVSKTWEGIKASAMAAMNYLNGEGKNQIQSTGNVMSDMAVQATMAFSQAYAAQGKVIDLGRDAKNAATLTAAEDMQIQLLIKDIRDRTTSAAQAQKDYNKVLEINGKQYQRNHDIAVQNYKSQIDLATAGYKLTGDEIKSLLDLSKGYDKVTESAKKLVYEQKVGTDFLDKLNENLQAIIAVDNKKAQSDEMAKIRDDMKQSRDEARAEKEKQLQDEIARATEQANSEMTATTLKMLLSQQEAFGRTLSETEEKARQSIFKLQQEIEKNQAIANDKKHSPKTRKAALDFIKTAQEDEKKIRQANYLEIEQLAVDHNRQMIETAAKGALDLKAVQIQGIEDLHKKELETIENNHQEKLQVLKNENQTIQDNINKLTTEIGTEKDPIKLQALKTTLNEQMALLGDNAALVVAYEKQKQQAIEKTILQYENEKQANIDETNTLRQRGINAQSGTNDKEVLAAEQKQLLDQYAADVSAKGLTDEKKLELEQKYLNDKAALDQQYAQKQKDYDLQVAQQVEDAAFKIIQQSMERSNQAFEVNLNRQKEYDLSNQSLTATQKYEINEKYRVLEGRQKVKEFKQEQELALAKAVIDTAAAILKASPNVPLMALAGATGVLEIAVIASQKPPAYAQGGIHKYESDGKGGVLPGYSKKDNTNAYLRSGEAVVVSEAMRDPWARNIVSAINQSYGGRPFDSPVSTSWIMPGFASGGVFTNYLPTGDNGLRPNPLGTTTGRLHPDDITGIASAVSSMNFSLPPLDIKDVNYQQQRLTSPYDRANY